MGHTISSDFKREAKKSRQMNNLAAFSILPRFISLYIIAKFVSQMFHKLFRN